MGTGGGTGQQGTLRCGSPARPTPLPGDEMLGPGTGAEPTQSTHTRGRDMFALTQTYPIHTHTHTPCASVSQMHRATYRHTVRGTLTSAQSTDTFTLRLQNVRMREGEGVRWPGVSLLPGPHPSTYWRHHPRPLFDPSPRGPILSRCEMCNSRGWCCSTPGREKGRSRPPSSEGPRPGPGPAGGKASWKEALVRHGAGGRGGHPQMFLLPCPQGQGAAWGVEGQCPPNGPLQMPHRVPGPQPLEEALGLCSCSSQRPHLSLDIIAFLPPWGEAAGQPPGQDTWSLTAGLEGSPTMLCRPPGGPAEGSLRGQQQRRGRLPVSARPEIQVGPPLHLRPSLGLVLIKNWNPPATQQAGSWAGGRVSPVLVWEQR